MSDKKITMVRCPRERLAVYCHLAWNEVAAAATRGTDGLSVDEPQWTPFPDSPPRKPETDDPVALENYARLLEMYEHDKNMAYLRPSTDFWSKGKTLLYQQGW